MYRVHKDLNGTVISYSIDVMQPTGQTQILTAGSREDLERMLAIPEMHQKAPYRSLEPSEIRQYA